MQRCFFTLLLILMTATGMQAQELVDRIIAVVNEDIILQSEIDEAVGLQFAQSQEYPSEEEIQVAREKYLEQMVENLILVDEAKKQGIVVQSGEVNQTLEETIGRIKGNFPSDEAFERELAKEGLSIADLRRRYTEDIRNQLMINRLIDEKIRAQIEVSAQEVKTLYEERQDEIPEYPERVTISHILIPIEMAEDAETVTLNRAKEIRQMAVNGADFSELANTYSQGPGAINGGNIGFFERGDMLPEFEEIAFKIGTGEISEPVRTSLGYHIIKVNEKQADRVSAAHILFKVAPGEGDTLRALETAGELLNRIQNGENFAELARQYSADENTREDSGELGTYSLNELVPPYSDAVGDLDVGDVSRPILGDFGYHLIRVDAREAPRPLNFEDVRAQLEEMVRQEKMAGQYEELIEKLRTQNYVEIRPFM